ncbi:unnamed protein product [Clavelina lepadiformis]|uniref:Uncharacterized protein n=1 Tax=Clavelina lepadiformis TaxID=159417 RepID=A0ABP0EZN1_CLALP
MVMCLKLQRNLILIKQVAAKLKPNSNFGYSTNGGSISTSTVSTSKPLVLMLPWLGATKSAASKYIKLYEEVGCQVLVKHSYYKDFLWPATGLNNSRRFLLDVKKKMETDNQPIIIHSMSIGCYFYALMLIHLQREPDIFRTILDNIKVQVVDSPVVGTLEEMAIGVSTTSTKNRTISRLIKSSIMSYFALSRPFTVKIYTEAIDAMKLRPCVVPSLILSSTDDPMALPESVKDFIRSWENVGVDVTSKVWTDSGHVQHLRNHPVLYKDMLYEVLGKSLGRNLTLRAKL